MLWMPTVTELFPLMNGSMCSSQPEWLKLLKTESRIGFLLIYVMISPWPVYEIFNLKIDEFKTKSFQLTITKILTC